MRSRFDTSQVLGVATPPNFTRHRLCCVVAEWPLLLGYFIIYTSSQSSCERGSVLLLYSRWKALIKLLHSIVPACSATSSTALVPSPLQTKIEAAVKHAKLGDGEPGRPLPTSYLLPAGRPAGRCWYWYDFVSTY